MKNTPQTQNKWQALYELAVDAQEVAAWEWLYEDQIFGLRLPNNPYTWYVSVMGTSGEHLCYCFYRGEAGLEAFKSLKDKLMSEDEPQEALLMYYQLQFMRAQNCIQVSFEEMDLMSDEQLAHLERIGMQWDENELWTSITDWTPDLQSWPIEEDQIDVVHTLLQKTLEIAQLYLNCPGELPQWEGYDTPVPIFTATQGSNGHLEWTQTLERVDGSKAFGEPYQPLYPDGWAQLKRMPQKKVELGAGRMLPISGIQPSDDVRPYYLNPVVVFDPKAGNILGVAMSSEDAQDVEAQVFQIIMDFGICPTTVLVGDPVTLHFLKPCLDLANIKVALHDGATQLLAMITEQMNEMPIDEMPDI